MKVFITKYALSDGINEADMTYTEASENSNVQVNTKGVTIIFMEMKCI